MPAVKSASEVATKWSRVTPQRTEDYRGGVENPRRDWASATKAAASAYKEGVTKAAQEGRFEKGVGEAGTEKWQSKAATKGVERWGPGVAAGANDYEKGFEPYRDTIERTKLPKRYPKGDPRNIERVRVMAKALRDRKVAGA